MLQHHWQLECVIQRKQITETYTLYTRQIICANKTLLRSPTVNTESSWSSSLSASKWTWWTSQVNSGRHVTCWLCPAQRPAWTTRGTWWGQVPRRRRDRDTPSRLRYLMERNTVEWVCWRSACSSLTLFAQDYDDFDVANEDDELEEFLGIPRKTPKVWIELKKKTSLKLRLEIVFHKLRWRSILRKALTQTNYWLMNGRWHHCFA